MVVATLDLGPFLCHIFQRFGDNDHGADNFLLRACLTSIVCTVESFGQGEPEPLLARSLYFVIGTTALPADIESHLTAQGQALRLNYLYHIRTWLRLSNPHINWNLEEKEKGLHTSAKIDMVVADAPKRMSLDIIGQLEEVVEAQPWNYTLWSKLIDQVVLKDKEEQVRATFDKYLSIFKFDVCIHETLSSPKALLTK